MADLALSAAQTLFAALDCSVLYEIASIRDYKQQLEDLKDTVSTIQKVLLDADSLPNLSAQQQHYVEMLKDAVYDADDLFDEVLTLAELKKRNKGSKTPLDKVRDFFSSKNSLIVARSTSKKVKEIRNKLESIASNHKKFGFEFDSKPIRERREDSCHYVYKPNIVGRENDVNIVIERLLATPDIENNVEFLTIVGVGGLGKTAVAQLVYDDERIIKEFAVLRFWVCVADQDGQHFDVRKILSKVLQVADKDLKLEVGSSIEIVVDLFQKTLGGKKCLLVLDDIWNEKRYEWSKLRDYLMILGKGSRILATTRSIDSAGIIGGGDTHTYKLDGLSHEDSRKLFQLTAFGDEGEPHCSELVEIGENILNKCKNVPLAIKVVGSLLFGQETSKWRAVEDNWLKNASEDGDEIISILKLSYDNLDSSLKSCFTYCAMFPKDFVIEKENLIFLWMAQGFIKALDGQSIEVAANENFSILLRRCFFQDVEMDRYGEVESCKVHDLMHDVAQKVGGKEICVASSLRSDSDYHRARHVFEDRPTFKDGISFKSKMRSFVGSNPDICSLIANWGHLRSLSLSNAPIEELPTSIDKLLHLRYFSLVGCRKLKKLPNTITKLHNLQTLILRSCETLEELPKDLSKLIHLRHLNIYGCGKLKEWPKEVCKLVHLRALDIRECWGLRYMPSGMGKLTNLSRLSEFHVSNGSSRGQLSDLKTLVNLKGKLTINIRREYRQVEDGNEGESGCLVAMKHLQSLRLQFSHIDEEEMVERDETLMIKLQPPANLRYLKFVDYMGRRVDNWASFLPLLAIVSLYHCARLKHLPILSQLEHLRVLTLDGLKDLEYVEEKDDKLRSSDDGGASSSSSSSSSRSVTFFPSLEILFMGGMPKLKGWRGRSGAVDVIGDTCQPSSFPRLSQLTINGCPDLISMPSCPALERVALKGVNERLRLIATPHLDINVRHLIISHVSYLQALPPCRPTHIDIIGAEVEDFSGAGEVFQTHVSDLQASATCHIYKHLISLQHLKFSACCNLRSLKGGGFQHLTALETLTIKLCPELELNEEDDGEGIPWRSLHHSLRDLDLGDHGVNDFILPRGVRCLSNLQDLRIPYSQHLEVNLQSITHLSSLKSLTITRSSDLKSMPEAMWSLTSLSKLQIKPPYSEELKERCRNPNGEDWPKIQHIPNIIFNW